MPRSVPDAATGSLQPTPAEATASEALPMEAPASEALGLMVEALRLIDRSGGAGIAGAHLDLAIHRLREWINRAQA